MKRILVWAVAGAFIGDLVGVLVGARALSYWFRPPGVTDQDRCVVQIDAALRDLGEVQAIAAAVGLVLFVIFGLLWRRRSAATPAQEAVK